MSGGDGESGDSRTLAASIGLTSQRDSTDDSNQNHDDVVEDEEPAVGVCVEGEMVFLHEGCFFPLVCREEPVLAEGGQSCGCRFVLAFLKGFLLAHLNCDVNTNGDGNHDIEQNRWNSQADFSR